MSRLMVSLSRTFTMTATPKPLHWDIFCNVIDNYGDIGVCWRLARQLAGEYGFFVRLWVDELEAFQRLCPEIRTDLAEQKAQGVEVRRWTADFPAVIPGDVVIEAFACRLPERFEIAMAERTPQPVWINLDYLSAENWVTGCHALPSPHPRLPLTKYFFFPGFTENTGGLLHEADLDRRRQAFMASPSEQQKFMETLGIPALPSETLQISLFSYENPALDDLLSAWADGTRPIRCLAPLTRNQSTLESFAGHTVRIGDVVRRGSLELRIIPFVAQHEYDKLLWISDLNFVRGEDSFVRAQWAGKPMIWQIYPQDDEAHRVKLLAFLDAYCAGWPEKLSRIVRTFFLAWNGEGRITPERWGSWMSILGELHTRAGDWQKKLSKQQDLCSSLVQFCRSKL